MARIKSEDLNENNDQPSEKSDGHKSRSSTFVECDFL